MTVPLGELDITYDEIINTTLAEKIEILRAKRIALYGTDEITPEMAEADFFRLMERFREVGDRNFYGNACAVFVPPSGYGYNEEVSNTYYYMYEGALNGSEAFGLMFTMIEATLDYAISGGSKNMLEWIVEVGMAVAMQQNENETADPENVLVPTLTYIINQNYQSPLTVAYIFG